MSARSGKTTRLLDDTRIVGIAMLVGAAIVLWLAFQAQTGLPWEATRTVYMDVRDAGKLARNAEVRVGGARVGQVLSLAAVPRQGQTPPHARLKVQLEGDYRDLPADTTAEVRLASVLGGKYLSIVPGRSRETIPEGGTLPLRNAVAGVDIEDALAVFDQEGRTGMRRLVRNLGDALAGRGAELNESTDRMAALMPPLQRVLRTLIAEDTDLAGLVTGLATATRPLAAAAPQLGLTVRDAETTMGALDAAGAALGESIEELTALGRDATAALATVQPVLDDAAAIAVALRPAGTVLEDAMTEADGLLRTATRVDPHLGTLAGPIGRALGAVDTFAANPAASGSLRLLGANDLATFGTSAFVGLGAILAAAWDAEKHCAVTSTWMARLAEISSDGDESGNWIRMIPFFERDEFLPSAGPAPRLHANPYPNENAQECEAGNEGYLPGRQIGNPPGLQPAAPGGSR